MSFYMQLKLLGLQRNLIFNQGSFFEEGGVGGGVGGVVGKAIWRIVCTSEKILASPSLPLVRSLRFTKEVKRVHFSATR